MSPRYLAKGRRAAETGLQVHDFPPARGSGQQGTSSMATALTEKFSRLVKTMSGQARITESNVQD
ncbi:MAG: hypothetical protein V4636_05760, partial [Pseudomonadota bacterium]